MTLERLSDVLTPLETRLQLAGRKDPAVSGQRSSSAISRYVAGLTDLLGLQGELQDLGYGGGQLERLMASAQLDRAEAIASLKADIAVAEFRRGDLDVQLLKARLMEAGYGEEAAGLTARLEAARQPGLTPDYTSVGIVLEVNPADELEASRLESVSVGLQLEISEGADVPEATRESVSVGLQLEPSPADEVGVGDGDQVSIGLAIQVPLFQQVPDATRAETTVGIVLEIPATAEV